MQGWSIDSNSETDRFIQEFRALSNNDGPFQWTAGIFYKKSDDFRADPQRPLAWPGREPAVLLHLRQRFPPGQREQLHGVQPPHLRRGRVRVDHQRVGEQFQDVANTILIDEYDITHARVTLSSATDTRWSA